MKFTIVFIKEILADPGYAPANNFGNVQTLFLILFLYNKGNLCSQRSRSKWMQF